MLSLREELVKYLSFNPTSSLTTSILVLSDITCK